MLSVFYFAIPVGRYVQGIGIFIVKNISVSVTVKVRAVTKILSCWISTTSRRGIKQLGISFGSIFLLFSYENSWVNDSPGK